MKHINAALRTSLVRPVHFRSFVAIPLILLLVIFTLFQNGGRVVKADTIIGTAEKWNATAWRTEAFYSNPMTGFAVP